MLEIGQNFTWRGNSTFTACTGYEGVKGICWWCGQLHDKKTQCCSHEHKQQYLRHFDWAYAADWALERAGCERQYRSYGPGFCCECGRLFKRYQLEVHHIVRVNGGKRSYSVLNCPCNLIVLCLDCHNITKRKPKIFCPPDNQRVMELNV